MRPVEEATPPKMEKEKGRRRKKTPVEEEIVAEKENNFNFDELSGIKIQVFECVPIFVLYLISVWTANASELCEKSATKSIFSPKKFFRPGAFIRKRLILKRRKHGRKRSRKK